MSTHSSLSLLRDVALLALLLSACRRAPGPEEGAVRAPVEPPAPATMQGLDEHLAQCLEEKIGAVRARPGDVLPWVELGMTYEAHAMFELAEPCYERAVELDGSQARHWYRLAVAHKRNGRLDAALEAVARTCELAPDYAPALDRRGAWLLELHELEEAARCFERALALDPADPAAAIGLAQVRLEAGEPERALEGLEDPDLLAGPNGPLARRVRGTALARLGREEEAARELALGKSARTVYPDPWSREVQEHRIGTSAALLKATRLLTRGRADAAAQVLEEARERSPDDSRVLRKLASVYTRLARPADARAALEEAVALEPDDALLRVGLCWALSMGGDFEAALACMDDAIAVAPRAPEVHANKAQLLLELGRFAAVVEAVDAAAQRGVVGGALEVIAGKALVELERHEDALARFAAAAARDDGSAADAWVGRTIALLRLGRDDEAAEALRRAEASDPAHGMLPELRAELEERGGEDGDG